MKAKSAILAASAALASPLAFAVARTLLNPQKRSVYIPTGTPEREQLCAEKLSKMVQCETVSSPENRNIPKFLELHKLLEELFPLVHERLEKTEIDGNLLFYWKGDSSEKPVVLMSHQDVVPAKGEWSYPPFSGAIAEGKLWGRGSTDTKCTVMAFLQAVEELIAEGCTPKQDVYLASSCTEEWAGDGAGKLIAELRRRGVKPWLVCDEGGAIIKEPVGGVKDSLAMIGVYEKGKGDIRLSARSKGGHSSAPPKNTPIARLAAFINRMEKHPPYKMKFGAELEAMLSALAPYASFGMRLLLGNLWLFKPLLKLAMPMVSTQASAMLKTTVAFTMQSGSEACNVIPSEASVCANLRFVPHQPMDESIEIISRIAAGYGIETEIINAHDYTKPVDTESEQWELVVKAINLSFPGLAHSPYVMNGGTDCSFWQDICEHCIRFGPVVFGPEQLKGMHGIDECIDIDCLPGAVDFYKNLIRLNK